MVIWGSETPVAIGELLLPVPLVFGIALKVVEASTAEAAAIVYGRQPSPKLQHFYACEQMHVQPEQRSAHGTN
jgi:hypothetical protein